jgi:hypothetical protein
MAIESSDARPAAVTARLLGEAGWLRDAWQGARSQVEPVLRRAAELAEPHAHRAAALAEPHLRRAAGTVDAHLAPLQPWQVAALSALLALLVAQLLARVRSGLRLWQDKGAPPRCTAAGAAGTEDAAAACTIPQCNAPNPRPHTRALAPGSHTRSRPCTATLPPARFCPSAGWQQLAAGCLLDLPLVRGLVARQQAALRAKLRAQLSKGAASGLRELPEQGATPEEVRAMLTQKARVWMWVCGGGGCGVCRWCGEVGVVWCGGVVSGSMGCSAGLCCQAQSGWPWRTPLSARAAIWGTFQPLCSSAAPSSALA